MASAYGNDEEMQGLIIKLANPLPVNLRGIIAETIGDGLEETQFALSLLKDYDLEESPDVKTLASIGYHTRLIQSGMDTRDAIEYLSKSIVCYGPDHEERRQAAFCGLVLLDRLDIMINAKETSGSDRICAISLGSYHSKNVPLTRFILQKWNTIKNTLREEFFSRIGRSLGGPLLLWDAFCLFADQYAKPTDEAISFLENQTDKASTPNILSFLGRVRPKSALLLEYCLHAINVERHSMMDDLQVAAELLGTHFAGDHEALARIISVTGGNLLAPQRVIPVCEGWAESDEMENIFNFAQRQRKLHMSYPAYFQLISRKSPSDKVFEAIMNALWDDNEVWHKKGVVRPMLRRLKADDDLFDMLQKKLMDKPTASEKATIPKLLGSARGVNPTLRDWCIKEIDYQLSGKEPPGIGIDLFALELRPVVHCLMEVLEQPNWREAGLS